MICLQAFAGKVCQTFTPEGLQRFAPLAYLTLLVLLLHVGFISGGRDRTRFSAERRPYLLLAAIVTGSTVETTTWQSPHRLSSYGKIRFSPTLCSVAADHRARIQAPARIDRCRPGERRRPGQERPLDLQPSYDAS